MEEKIDNSIALCQNNITEFEKIKERIEKSETEDIRIKIETKHWYGFSEPHFGKEKHKIEIPRHSAIKLMDTAIKIEKDKIDKLIDMEIENRKKIEKSSSKE